MCLERLSVLHVFGRAPDDLMFRFVVQIYVSWRKHRGLRTLQSDYAKRSLPARNGRCGKKAAAAAASLSVADELSTSPCQTSITVFPLSTESFAV